MAAASKLYSRIKFKKGGKNSVLNDCGRSMRSKFATFYRNVLYNRHKDFREIKADIQ